MALDESPTEQTLAETESRGSLVERYREVRQASVTMCQPLKAEDYRIQPVAEVSPPWWNLGHTSWFFARNILLALDGETTDLDEQLHFVLNSYYVSLGNRLAHDRRGLMTRPTTDEIYDYRDSVDQRMLRLIDSVPESRLAELSWLLTIGVQHEQQHQELFYTEIKSISAQNPPNLRAAYLPHTVDPQDADAAPESATILRFPGGLFDCGNVEGGWCWDNELPTHQRLLTGFGLSNRLVTNGEYLEFVEDGGYDNQLLWLDNGWSWRCREAWQAPLYWEHHDHQWNQWTLRGLQQLGMSEPVCHLSFYEADAFAGWKAETFEGHRSARLPTEYEWETAARSLEIDPRSGNQLGRQALHPIPAPGDTGITQMFGDVWEWTASYYEPYPGYEPFAGNLTEYNAKFMDNQRVLRGGSCVTPPGHLRLSYRNFWSGETRFQFTGLRLAYDEIP